MVSATRTAVSHILGGMLGNSNSSEPRPAPAIDLGSMRAKTPTGSRSAGALPCPFAPDSFGAERGTQMLAEMRQWVDQGSMPAMTAPVISSKAAWTATGGRAIRVAMAWITDPRLRLRQA